MMRSVLSRYRRRSRGQALVEFTLTALVFLLLLVMIVEVARILAAYVTLQHAARQAARYAITGNWEANYATDPIAHYDPNSLDAFERIPPCWPLFPDDPAIPVEVPPHPDLPVGPDWYEPFRNARTCSIEQVALTGMTGLALNPDSADDEPNYYIIQVSGYSVDRYPQTGTFERDSGPENYSTYFTLPEHAGDNTGLAPGYGGGPNQKVVVQIYYRLPIITPLVSAIVPSLTLNGTAVMTNESFGSTSLQREAIQPPNLPAIPPLGPPDPADLVITSLSTASATGDVGVPVTFDLEIANVGDKNVSGAGYSITLYASLDGTLGTDTPLPVGADTTPADGYPDNPSTVIQIGQLAVGPDLVGGQTTTLTINGTFLAGGDWHVYGWIDSNEVVDEEEPAREANNGALHSSVIVGAAVNLSVPTVSPSKLEPGLTEPIDFTVTVANAGGLTDAINVTLTTTLPAEMTYTGATIGGTPITCNPLGGNQWECEIGTVLSGGAQTMVFRVNLAYGAPQEDNVMFTAAADPAQTEIDPSDDFGIGTIFVGGTNLKVTKTVSDPEPDVNDIITYTIDVLNEGPNQATNVEITDLLPGQVTWQSDDSGGAYNPGTGIWTIGTLNQTTTATLNIDVQVTTAGSGILNQASLTALDQPESQSGDNTSSVSITSEQVDLGVVKAVDATENYEGGTITYTLTVTNNSIDTDATNITLVDALPSGLTYDSHFPLSGVTVTGNTITWDIAVLNPGSFATLNVDAIIDAGTDGTTIQNTTQSLTLDQADTIPGNNTASDVGFTVDNRTDLGLSVSTTVNGTSGTTASVGDTVVFTWRIANNGPMDATDLSVTLDDILELANWSSITVEDESGNPLDLSSTLGDLAAGDFMDIIVTATVANIAADTTDTFAATVSAATPDDLDDSPGGSTDPEDDSVTMTLMSGPQQFVNETFDTSRGCFSTFGAIGSAYPLHHAAEVYPAAGVSGNALRVDLGFGTPDNDADVAGGWTCNFNVGSAVAGSVLTFAYRINPNADYDAGEHTSVVVEVDGAVIVAPQVYWSQDTDTGWQVARVNVGALGAGSHTISIGGYNNQKTQSTENGYVIIDSLNLSEVTVLLNGTFNTNSNGMVATPAQAFQGLIGGSPHNSNGNSNASYAAGQGNPAGSLRIDVGEYAATDTDPTNMSAGYEYTFTLSSDSDVYLEFDYSLSMAAGYENNEHSYVLASLDDTTLFGSDLNNSVFHAVGGGGAVNTGWVSSGSLYLGNLPAGTHTIMIGGFNNAATTLDEDTIIYIDNVFLTAE